MVSSSVGAIFLLYHIILHVTAQNHEGQNCPSFKCGRGVYSYPYTTIFNPNCGLCFLNCTEPAQSLAFTTKGPWYDIMYSFLDNKTFLVGDLALQHVVSTDICGILDKGNIVPSSGSISIKVINNETLWQCPKNYEMVKYGSNKSETVNFLDIRNCSSSDIYRCKYYFDSFPLQNCTPHQYPTQMIVQLSTQCSKCRSQRGRCKDLKNGDFTCIYKKKGRRKLILCLTLGILGGSLVIVVLAMFFWYIWRVKLRSSKLISRNISADPAATDLGRSKIYFSLPIFSYTELEEATKYFDRSMELGDGGFGTVYYGKLKDGRAVAVKRLYERNYRQLEQYLNEIQILTCLHHQNLVSLYGCTSRRSRELLLVYEYVSNGTVADHLYGEQAKCGTLTWPIRMRIAIETARALSYLHASDIIHRDVKSNNILLDHNFSVKVADFGLSKLFPTDATHISTVPQGTPGYLDPEYHQCYQLSGKSDVYSFGVVLIELISSLPAIDISRKDDEVNLSCYAMKRIECCAIAELVDPRLGYDAITSVKRMTTSVAELAFRCLQHKKEFRPSMDEILKDLEAIEDADYEVPKVQEKRKTVNASKAQTEADHLSLLKNTDIPPSPNSVMQNWGSSNSITPATSI